MRKKSEVAAEKIIDKLMDRCGFDAIWDYADEETRKEILQEMVEIIEREMAS